MIPVFIGYDPTESAAFHVLAHSIHKQSSLPVSITPLRLSQLTAMYRRERDPTHSTEFSLSRFLVPQLCDFAGYAIFMDCDMMFRGDIAELWAQRYDGQGSVNVVKHEYTPSTTTKMLGQQQTVYPMKNWSSLMLFNNRNCRGLTDYYIGKASGLELHQFHWATEGVGDLDPVWNHLIGEQEYREDAKNVHWTLGGPWWPQYAETDYAREWRQMYADMLDEAGILS